MDLENRFHIVATDVNKYAAGMLIADHAFLSIPSSSSEYFEFILKNAHKFNVKLILPTRNGELEFFSVKAPDFEEEDIIVPISEPSTIRTCLDKVSFAKWIEKNNYKTPNILDPSNISEINNEQLFVKPRFGAGSTWAMKIRANNTLDLLKINPDLIIQEFIPGREITMDVFSSLNSQVLSIVPRERICIVRGETHVGKTINNEKIIKETLEISNKLNLKGPSTFQCIIDENKEIFWIEVNPRIGGAAALGFEAGNQTPENIVRLAAGKKIISTLRDYLVNLHLFRFSTDMFLEQGDFNDRIRDF